MSRIPGLLGAVLLTVLTACSAATTPDPDATGPAVVSVPGAVPRPDHVMVVVFENEDATAVFGASSAPYLTTLAASGAAFTEAHGVAHPSQPNYVALFSGSTHGVTDDACPQSLAGPNLATGLQSAGRTFTGYSEDLPGAGYTGCSAGSYARKHNPWADFADVPAAANQPLSALPQDYGALPTVAVVVPNLCHDMHSCPIATGDAWARQHLAPYVTWAATHNSLLIVDHYNVLRTLEDMYGLPALGASGAAQPLAGIWRAVTP